MTRDEQRIRRVLLSELDGLRALAALTPDQISALSERLANLYLDGEHHGRRQLEHFVSVCDDLWDMLP